MPSRPPPTTRLATAGTPRWQVGAVRRRLNPRPGSGTLTINVWAPTRMTAGPATFTVHEQPLASDGNVLQSDVVDLTTAERALQNAQRQGDVDALDALLHPRVVAAGPDGEVFTKADDLESHRSGALRVSSLVEESLDVEGGTTTGRTRMTAFVEAEQGGSPVRARLVYNRLWVRDGGGWRVLAATFAPA